MDHIWLNFPNWKNIFERLFSPRSTFSLSWPHVIKVVLSRANTCSMVALCNGNPEKLSFIRFGSRKYSRSAGARGCMLMSRPPASCWSTGSTEVNELNPSTQHYLRLTAKTLYTRVSFPFNPFPTYRPPQTPVGTTPGQCAFSHKHKLKDPAWRNRAKHAALQAIKQKLSVALVPHRLPQVRR